MGLSWATKGRDDSLDHFADSHQDAYRASELNDRNLSVATSIIKVKIKLPWSMISRRVYGRATLNLLHRWFEDSLVWSHRA